MNTPGRSRKSPVDLDDRQAVTQFLAAVPKPCAVAFAVRCAERVAPLVLDDHPDAVERLNAVEAVLRVVEAWGQGRAVSRFTLRLVRDVAYDVADVCDAAGPTLYAAAAANENDPSRSVAKALREAMRLGDDEARRVIAVDFAVLPDAESQYFPLWPDGEPDWSRTAREKLETERPRLVTLFELPAGVEGPRDT